MQQDNYAKVLLSQKYTYQKKTLQLLPPFVQMSVMVLYCYNTILSAIYGIGIVIMFNLYVMYINDVYAVSDSKLYTWTVMTLTTKTIIKGLRANTELM